MAMTPLPESVDVWRELGPPYMAMTPLPESVDVWRELGPIWL